MAIAEYQQIPENIGLKYLKILRDYGTSTRELRNTSMTLVPSLKDLCLKKVVKDNVKNYEDLPTVPT